jgi:hypothetical protein
MGVAHSAQKSLIFPIRLSAGPQARPLRETRSAKATPAELSGLTINLVSKKASQHLAFWGRILEFW